MNGDAEASCHAHIAAGFPDWWFPSVTTPATVLAAKAVCSGCPVQVWCAARSVQLNPMPESGVWAGMTYLELRKAAKGVRVFCEGCGRGFVRSGYRSRFCSRGCASAYSCEPRSGNPHPGLTNSDKEW